MASGGVACAESQVTFMTVSALPSTSPVTHCLNSALAGKLTASFGLMIKSHRWALASSKEAPTRILKGLE